MLSWLRDLFKGSISSPAPDQTVSVWPSRPRKSPSSVGSGGFDFEVVGESFYQDHLREVSAGRVERGDRHVTFPCTLRWEINDHTHESAVRVEASGGRLVGHFAAEVADIYAQALHDFEATGHVAECQGVLVGGQPDKPSFGVWLNFKPKLLG